MFELLPSPRSTDESPPEEAFFAGPASEFPFEAAGVSVFGELSSVIAVSEVDDDLVVDELGALVVAGAGA